MLLTIHNLPSGTRYSDLKTLIQTKCGLTDLILDNLVNEGGGTKRVTVGFAEESDAAILVRKINGLFLEGQQLYVENVRQKKASEQPFRSSVSEPQIDYQQSYQSQSFNNQIYQDQTVQDPMSMMMQYNMAMGGMYYMPTVPTIPVATPLMNYGGASQLPSPAPVPNPYYSEEQPRKQRAFEKPQPYREQRPSEHDMGPPFNNRKRQHSPRQDRSVDLSCQIIWDTHSSAANRRSCSPQRQPWERDLRDNLNSREIRYTDPNPSSNRWDVPYTAPINPDRSQSFGSRGFDDRRGPKRPLRSAQSDRPDVYNELNLDNPSGPWSQHENKRSRWNSDDSMQTENYPDNQRELAPEMFQRCDIDHYPSNQQRSADDWNEQRHPPKRLQDPSVDREPPAKRFAGPDTRSNFSKTRWDYDNSQGFSRDDEHSHTGHSFQQSNSFTSRNWEHNKGSVMEKRGLEHANDNDLNRVMAQRGLQTPRAWDSTAGPFCPQLNQLPRPRESQAPRPLQGQPPRLQQTRPSRSQQIQPSLSQPSQPSRSQQSQPLRSQQNQPPRSQQNLPSRSQQNQPSRSQQNQPPRFQQDQPSRSQQDQPPRSQQNQPPRSQQDQPPRSQQNQPSRSQPNQPPRTQQGKQYDKTRGNAYSQPPSAPRGGIVAPVVKTSHLPSGPLNKVMGKGLYPKTDSSAPKWETKIQQAGPREKGPSIFSGPLSSKKESFIRDPQPQSQIAKRKRNRSVLEKEQKDKPVNRSPIKNPTSVVSLIKRDQTWRYQAASAIAKDILKNVGIADATKFPDFGGLKSRIKSSIEVLLGDKLSVPCEDIIATYRQKFPAKDDQGFFDANIESIKLERIEKEKKAAAERAEREKEKAEENKDNKKETNASKGEMPPPPPPVVPPKPAPAPAPAKAAAKMITCNPPVRFTTLPANYPGKLPDKPPASGLLPKYPGADKKIQREQRMLQKKEALQEIVYELPPPLQSAVDSESDTLCDLFMSACEPDNDEEKKICVKISDEIADVFRKVVRMQLTKRILNVRTGLQVRVYAVGKAPRREALDGYLMRHGALSLKKSDKKNSFYIATMDSYQSYDALCAVQSAVVDGATIHCKPLHVTGTPIRPQRGDVMKQRRDFIQRQIDHSSGNILKPHQDDFTDDLDINDGDLENFADDQETSDLENSADSLDKDGKPGGTEKNGNTEADFDNFANDPEIDGDLGTFANDPETEGDSGTLAKDPETECGLGTFANDPETEGDLGTFANDPEIEGDLSNFVSGSDLLEMSDTDTKNFDESQLMDDDVEDFLDDETHEDDNYKPDQFDVENIDDDDLEDY